MRRHLLALLAPLALGACTRSDMPELDYSIDPPWPSKRELPPIGSGRIIVTNSMDDTLSLLDLDTLGSPDWAELARVPVGLNPVELEGPHHSAMSPSGDYYYVGLSLFVPGAGSGPHGAHGTGTADGYCLKLDAKDNRLVGSVRVDRNPGDLIISADGRTLYQTHFDLLKINEVVARGETDERKMDARLAILDADTLTRKAMVPVCPAPHAVRLSPDEKRAYVACISDEVAVVQLDDEKLPVTRIKVPNAGSALAPKHEPYALTLSPTDGALWVSSLKSRTVHYLDPESLQMVPERAIYGLRGSPMFGAVSADGRTLYMPYQTVEAVAVIDTATSAVKREIHLSPEGCLNVHQVELTPDGKHGLVVCEGDHRGPGTLHVLDLDAGTVTKTVPMGIFPDSVGILRRAP
uniref:DNA-binding beta-propeller fold protein YncE n=1 Tax=Vitiosangium cumulatum TaxID=1867796 RepID=A0A7D4XHI6_9BACT|nr:DNA-binding beta-propeller fold protein YncE [Vitiosangium cumulatum]